MKPSIRTARTFSFRSFILVLTPLLFLGLTFVQRFIFLRDINGALLLVSVLGVAVLCAVFLGERKGETIRRYLDALNVRRLSWRLFFFSVLIYGLYATGLVFPALPFTGDEPHYLLITKSLITDGDINLADDYQEKEYKAFYAGELDPHAYPGKKRGDFLYSRHLPALSLLITPFYVVGDKLGGVISSLTHQPGSERIILFFFSRLPICLLAALLGLVFFLSAWELTQDKKAALFAWLILSFTSPLVFYSHLIYPELPVALILAALAYGLILKKRTSSLNLFWAGLGIGLLPWFGIKYISLAGMALLIVVFVTARAGRNRKKAVASFLASLAVSAGSFLLFLHNLYGKISPQVVYRGSAEGTDLSLSRFLVKDWAEFLSRLLAFLIDQRHGLFVYAPILILSLAGFFLLWKRKSEAAYLLGGLFVAFWVFCSMTLYYAGFCPPGRPLLPVIWILGLFLAAALADERNKLAPVVRTVLLVLSLLVVIAVLPNPRLLYQDSMSFLVGPGHPEMPSRLLSSLNSLLVDWTGGTPMLATTVQAQKTWGVAFFWIIAILAVTVIVVWQGKAKNQERIRLGIKGHLALVAILGMAFVTLSFFDVRLKNGFALSGGEAFAQDENCLGPELGGFWVRGKSRAALIIRTERPVSEMSVILQSPVEGKTTVQLGSRKQESRRASRGMAEQVLHFPSPRPFRWKGTNLYTLQVKEGGGFYPYAIDKDSRDKRFLGVFIRLHLRYEDN